MAKKENPAETEFKTVARYSDPMTAHIVAGMLNDNGIPAAVFGEVSSYTCLNVNGIEVKVNAADYDAAVNLLAASDKAE